MQIYKSDNMTIRSGKANYLYTFIQFKQALQITFIFDLIFNLNLSCSPSTINWHYIIQTVICFAFFQASSQSEAENSREVIAHREVCHQKSSTL